MYNRLPRLPKKYQIALNSQDVKRVSLLSDYLHNLSVDASHVQTAAYGPSSLGSSYSQAFEIYFQPWKVSRVYTIPCLPGATSYRTLISESISLPARVTKVMVHSAQLSSQMERHPAISPMPCFSYDCLHYHTYHYGHVRERKVSSDLRGGCSASSCLLQLRFALHRLSLPQRVHKLP